MKVLIYVASTYLEQNCISKYIIFVVFLMATFENKIFNICLYVHIVNAAKWMRNLLRNCKLKT